HTYSLVSGTGSADNASFNISGNQLRTSASFNYEIKSSYSIRVQSFDGICAYAKQFEISINDVIETASFSINPVDNATILENKAYTSETPSITGTPIGNITYSIEGADANDFTVNTSTGVVSMEARDYETPQDANMDNIYEVVLRATDDDGNNTTEDWTVTVTQSNDILDFCPTDQAADDCNNNTIIDIPFNYLELGEYSLIINNIKGKRYIDPAAGNIQYKFCAPNNVLCGTSTSNDGEFHLCIKSQSGSFIGVNKISFVINNNSNGSISIKTYQGESISTISLGGTGTGITYTFENYITPFDSFAIISKYNEAINDESEFFILDSVFIDELPYVSVPSDLAASIYSSTEVELTWTDNSDNESYFEIERKETYCPTCDYEFISNAMENTTSIILGQSQDVSYTYRIRAFSDEINQYSNYSDEAEINIETQLLYVGIDKDALLYNYDRPGYEYVANTNYGTYTQFKAWTWTSNTYYTYMRSVLDFDLSSIPDGSVITGATLYLFGLDHLNYTITGNTAYKSNECWLQRITTPWEENTVTWNSQPSVTTHNQTTVANSVTTTQDYEVDVTYLLQDMVDDRDNSHGLMLILKSEQKYTRMVFASSDYTTPAKHPALEVSYIQLTGSAPEKADIHINTGSKEITEVADKYVDGNIVFGNLKIYPNPTTGTFTIEMNNVMEGSLSIKVNDLSGRLVESRVIEKNQPFLSEQIKILHEGLYIVTLQLGQNILTRKVLVE
ncbi:MAG: DNRLRE domain-containing protein, partial [Bacteroidales bacterium]|nr:DNRLRE domain-containing protein [Bacteroidales bacterium]